eukprot:TRINITY_DN1236_c0_g1_i1.p1 TRINITY_DN1236_c0_g1~~TRINITY_DN1236_c0_g1_i1.p1  ORF type:complete len:408 (+),score=50.10 TRINITY_DN1236_c0_g1_i1:1-1224(+)
MEWWPFVLLFLSVNASWNVTGGNLQRTKSSEDLPYINSVSWDQLPLTSGPTGCVFTDMVAIGEDVIVYTVTTYYPHVYERSNLIVAISRTNGTELWKYKEAHVGQPTGCIFGISGNVIVLSCTVRNGICVPTLVSFHPKVGTILWTKHFPGNGQHMMGPILVGDLIAVVVSGSLYYLSDQGNTMKTFSLSDNGPYSMISSDYPLSKDIYFSVSHLGSGIRGLYSVDSNTGEIERISDKSDQIAVTVDGREGYIIESDNQRVYSVLKLNLTATPVGIDWIYIAEDSDYFTDLALGHYYSSVGREDVIMFRTSNDEIVGLSSQSDLLWKIPGGDYAIFNSTVFVNRGGLSLDAFDVVSGKQLGSHDWPDDYSLHSFALASGMIYDISTYTTPQPTISSYAFQISKIFQK